MDAKSCIEVTTQYWQAPGWQTAHKLVHVSKELDANVLLGKDCIWWHIRIDNAEIPSSVFEPKSSQSALED